jgi:molybdenum cofactor biosynthesis protein MoaC
MIDVSMKEPTLRRAQARGRIFMAPGTAQRIGRQDMPKGDVLAMAEVAGLMAVKNTALLLPLCHPLPVEAIRIECELLDDGVEVTCEVTTVSKTGVEMEALCGVHAALLSIYDLTKIVDPVLEIGRIRLDFKEGGKSGHWQHPNATEGMSAAATTPDFLRGLRVAVITMSDRCSRGDSDDRSGPLLGELARKEGAEIVARRLVPDDIHAIQKAVRSVIEEGCDVILMTGGTGPAPRDVTPEAIRNLFDKELPGIGELLRSTGAAGTKKSYLSRSVAGLIGGRLVISFPGSPRAVTEGFAAIKDLIPHAVSHAQGRDPTARCGG